MTCKMVYVVQKYKNVYRLIQKIFKFVNGGQHTMRVTISVKRLLHIFIFVYRHYSIYAIISDIHIITISTLKYHMLSM